MWKRQISTFTVTYIFYILFLITRWHLVFYRIYGEVLSEHEINIFTGLDPSLFTRDILMFLLFILIFIPPIKSFEITRMTRTQYFKKCLRRVYGGH